nr:hypothetical protein [Tanacetum cinerariifolium]GEZ68001.1 hypothetical protein [Tanacetum cinerariifolium]
VVAFVVKEGVTPFVVDITVEMEKISSLEDFTVLEIKYSYFVYTGGNGIDVVVPVESIRTISDRFANSAYGFFLRNRVAYPVVANYVKNIWGKYGLVRSMFSSSIGLFSFQFSFVEGLDAMLENGPWFIQNNPLILKKWHPDENLLKEDVRTISVYVKSMVYLLWPSGEGHYTWNVRVEYEWKPPRCSSCKVFGHIHEECLKNTGASEKKL